MSTIMSTTPGFYSLATVEPRDQASGADAEKISAQEHECDLQMMLGSRSRIRAIIGNSR